MPSVLTPYWKPIRRYVAATCGIHWKAVTLDTRSKNHVTECVVVDLYSLHERPIVCCNAGKYLFAQALQIYRSLVVSFQINLVIHIFTCHLNAVCFKRKRDGLGDYNAVTKILLEKQVCGWMLLDAFALNIDFVGWCQDFLERFNVFGWLVSNVYKISKMLKTSQIQ